MAMEYVHKISDRPDGKLLLESLMTKVNQLEARIAEFEKGSYTYYPFL